MSSEQHDQLVSGRRHLDLSVTDVVVVVRMRRLDEKGCGVLVFSAVGTTTSDSTIAGGHQLDAQQQRHFCEWPSVRGFGRREL